MESDKQTREIELPVSTVLKEQRERLGLTQRQVADIASINIRLYQRLEYGERSLSRTSFRIGVAVADVLELDVHTLVHTPSVTEYLMDKQHFESMKNKNDKEK